MIPFRPSPRWIAEKVAWIRAMKKIGNVEAARRNERELLQVIR